MYKDRVTITHSYEPTKTVIFKTFYDLVFNEFSTDKNILFVDLVGDPLPEAGTDYFNMAFNRVNRVRSEFQTLAGNAQKILIKEQRFDTANIDLLHRSFNTTIASSSSSQHATTIATIIAGGGNSSKKAEGVAKNAFIGSSDFENILPDPDSIIKSESIHVENHSYGVGIENYYGNEAAAYDQQVYGNPTLVHIFSAGNLGNSIPDQGKYTGLNFANLSGNFKQAKNVLAVTAMDTSFLVNKRNSKGPAYDGRVKPEFAAFGQDGTSDAAAMVSGICLLLQERYVELFGQFPTAAEVKSILIVSADDLGPEGINYTSGYGSVNAYRAISVLNKEQIFTKTIQQGEVLTIPINVPPSIQKLKLAVTWIDPPALQNSSSALVNDIDGFLDNGSEILYPWVLNSQPSTDSLTAIALRKPDHTNNAEYFTVDEPVPGLYNLTLTAPEITSAQPLSVAYWFEEKKTFEWSYPTGSDKLEANEKTTLLWDVQNKQPGSLSLQLNDGEWQIINESVPLNSYFHWLPPDTLGTARLKMKIDNEEFITGTFLISPKPKLSVAFDCGDQFGLTWGPVPGADQYEVYTMGEYYLELQTTVADTFVILPKTSHYYFAVAPKRNQTSGLKNQTINYTDQGAFCYINLFDVERYEDDRITLQLNLSSTLNVDYVIVYKIQNDENSQLNSTTVNSKTRNLLWYDYELTGGLMRYQAEIVLTSGEHIQSDIREIYVGKKGKAILFPNPVQDDELKILSEGAGLTVKILNLTGEVAFTQELRYTLDSIDTSNLPKGLYILQLMKGNILLDSKKFLKI